MKKQFTVYRCVFLFFSDKTAYFKWLQTSKELKGNGASGKRNSVSFLLTNVLRGMQAADPQNDQHRPLSKVGTTKSGENQKESSYVQFFSYRKFVTARFTTFFHNFSPSCSTLPNNNVSNQSLKMFGIYLC